MRIGFDVSQTGRGRAGCGYFADSLVRRLAEIDRLNEYIIYPTFGDHYWDPTWRQTVCRVKQQNFRLGLAHHSREAAKDFWNARPTERDALLGYPDVLHSNNFFCPIDLRSARLVYTLYDLSFLANPEWTTEANRAGCFTGVFNASLHADFILAISHYSRRHFFEVFPHYPAERVAVSYPASRFALRPDLCRPSKLGFLLPDQYWLSVGTIEPRKNHRRLLAAYARLKAYLGKTFPLVLAGANWLVDDLKRWLDENNLRDDVVVLGYVDDSTVQWLYQNCFASLYPSLFEGFGLPVVEALSLGAPVIASNCSSIPEIVGEAGLLVDPFRDETIFTAMIQLIYSPGRREQMKVAALLQSQNFTWESTACSVLAAYEKVSRLPRLSGSPCHERAPLISAEPGDGEMTQDRAEQPSRQFGAKRLALLPGTCSSHT
jgi:glycosyltransferase involved in cell wall biosynthesis